MQVNRFFPVVCLFLIASFLFFTVTDVEAVRYLTTEDNEDNAGTHVADGDMDPTCVFNVDAVHPVEFNINVTGALPTQNAYLSVFIGDVDLPDEVDEVFLNGHSLGFAVGQNALNNSTLFVIPDLSWVLPGNNLVQVFVDRNTVDVWCARVANGQIIIDEGGGAGPATIRTMTSDATAYNFGDPVTIDLEVDTPTSQNTRLELILRDPNGNNIAFETNAAALNWAITGSNDEPYQWVVNLPASGTSGLWSATLTVYDTTTEEFNATQTITFAVPIGATPVPTLASVSPSTGPAGSGITISGQNFIQGDTACTLGGQAVSNLFVVNATTMTGNVPSLSPGSYALSCTTPFGTGTLPNAFTVSGAVAPVNVPTINEWGMIMFMALAGIGAFYALKRRQV